MKLAHKSALLVATAVLLVLLTLPHGQIRAEARSATDSGTFSIRLEPTAMTVLGCTAPYSLVTIFDNNLPSGTVVSDGSGNFSKYTLLDSHGLHNVKVYSQDSLNLVTSTITKNISARDHFNNLVPVTLPPTATINDNVFATGEKITFIGTTCPFTDVTINIDNAIALNTRSNKDGEWYAVLSSIGFSYGQHSFDVSRLDEKGNFISSQRQLFRVVQALSEPRDLDRLQPDELEPPTITAPSDNHLSSSERVTITGTAQPNVQVELLRDGQIIGSVFSNPLGEWSFALTMLASQHSIQARACVSFGCSALSNEVTIFYQGALSECSFKLHFAKYRFFRQSINSGLDLELVEINSIPPYSLIIDWGDDSVENTRLTQNRSIKYHHVYKYIGNYNGIITISDSLGCTQTHYFSVEVVESKPPTSWFLWLLLGVYIFAVAASRKNPFIKSAGRS